MILQCGIRYAGDQSAAWLCVPPNELEKSSLEVSASQTFVVADRQTVLGIHDAP